MAIPQGYLWRQKKNFKNPNPFKLGFAPLMIPNGAIEKLQKPLMQEL